MTTLMVHLEVGSANTGLLNAASDLAGQLNASVMGVAACQPLRIIYGDGYVPDDIIQKDREALEKDISDAETEFRAIMGKRGDNLEWRSTVTFRRLEDYLADQARCADIIVTGVDHNESIFDTSRHVDIGDLVMQLGRPVLIVPTYTEKVNLERVLVAWKDTRESRRAILDALPLLRAANHVIVCEIASEEGLAAAQQHVADVVAWLKRDGITADPVAVLSTGDDAARLDAVASDRAADIIVAGAYGHGRLREWALGGVTKDLLLRADRCAFVSH